MTAHTAQRGCSLLEKTKELLEKYDGSYMEVYAKTGLQPSWISAMATGRVREPSVNKVQRLYEFLTGRALSL